MKNLHGLKQYLKYLKRKKGIKIVDVTLLNKEIYKLTDNKGVIYYYKI